MRKCPLNRFEECIKEECPFYNIKLGACVLPRLVLTMIRRNEVELKETTYESTTVKRS